MTYLIILICTMFAGLMSGMLGIGGGIVLFPLLYYFPGALGLSPIGTAEITGVTIVQGFFSSLAGLYFYGSRGYVHRALVLGLGMPLMFSSFAGAYLSGRAGGAAISITFAALAFVATAFMLLSINPRDEDEQKAEHFKANVPALAAVAVPLGVALGLTGQGGAFIILPMMLLVFQVPFKIAAGSMLFIGLFSSSSALAGKLITGQIHLSSAAVVIAGAVPMALVGGKIGTGSNTRALRLILATLICLSALKICLDVLK